MVLTPAKIRNTHRENDEVKGFVTEVVEAIEKYMSENVALEYMFLMTCKDREMSLTAKHSGLVVWAGQTSQLESIWDVWRLILELVKDQFRPDWQIGGDDEGTRFSIKFPPEK